jgi:hypothetical protein
MSYDEMNRLKQKLNNDGFCAVGPSWDNETKEWYIKVIQ